MKTNKIVNGPLPDTDEAFAEWEAEGKPYLWIKGPSAEGMELQLDVGYGHLRIMKGEEEVARTGGHVVQTEDGQWIGLAYLHGFEKGALFKRVGMCSGAVSMKTPKLVVRYSNPKGKLQPQIICERIIWKGNLLICLEGLKSVGELFAEDLIDIQAVA